MLVRSVELSYLSNEGLFQLKGNLVASISSVKETVCMSRRRDVMSHLALSGLELLSDFHVGVLLFSRLAMTALSSRPSGVVLFGHHSESLLPPRELLCFVALSPSSQAFVITFRFLLEGYQMRLLDAADLPRATSSLSAILFLPHLVWPKSSLPSCFVGCQVPSCHHCC